MPRNDDDDRSMDRKMFAAFAMMGLCAARLPQPEDVEAVAAAAVACADALALALDEMPPPRPEPTR